MRVCKIISHQRYLYKDFLGDIDQPKNNLHFGVLLLSNENICYAISLGKSHFYLRKFCDSDFGLNMAEKIIDASNLRIKNQNFIKARKIKLLQLTKKEQA